MHTFAAAPRRIHPPHFFEGPYLIKRHGRYLLMYSDGVVSEPSYRIRYSWAPAPDGPWTEPEASPILVTNEDGTVHGPGHHSVLRWQGADYLVYHRDANPHQGIAFRQICIDRLEYDDDGLIRRVVPTHRGGLPPSRIAGPRTWPGNGRPPRRIQSPRTPRRTPSTATTGPAGPRPRASGRRGGRWTWGPMSRSAGSGSSRSTPPGPTGTASRSPTTATPGERSARRRQARGGAARWWPPAVTGPGGCGSSSRTGPT